MDLTSDFWTGLLVGCAIGLMVGLLWQEAYTLLRDARRERKKMKNEDGRLSFMTWFSEWWKRTTSKWTTFGIVLTFIAVMQISLGVFQVIAYGISTSFTNCQAEYNQKSAEARKPRQDAAKKENDTFYAWLETLAPLIFSTPNTEPDPHQIEDFTRTYKAAIRAHRDNLKAQEENPYPPEPEETCG